MSTMMDIVRVLAATTAALMLVACMSHPPPPRHPGPYNAPVDAFNAVDTRHDPSVGPNGTSQPLSDDMAHLRDARQAYEHSQATQAAERRDQQARCRKNPKARLVHIQDGSGDPNAVYCQAPSGDSGRGGS